MQNTITVELLKGTGFFTWFDFVFNITGYTLSNGHSFYSYKDKEGNRKEITLDITQTLLEQMALEEAKLTLPLINVSSFSEFNMLVQGHKMRRNNTHYYIDVIVRNKEDQIVLKRLQYEIGAVDLLEELEKKYKDVYVYVEKENKMD
jgi:hypothetical protein